MEPAREDVDVILALANKEVAVVINQLKE